MLKYEPVSIAPSRIKQVTGLALAYQLRGMNADQRAVLAAIEFAVADRGLSWGLIDPTDRQFARIFGVSEYQLRQARDLDPNQRQRVLSGFRRLSDKAERLEKAMRSSGVELSWDTLVHIIS
jgi:hypothetical protein